MPPPELVTKFPKAVDQPENKTEFSRTDNGVLELARAVDVEELAGAQRESHTLVILLQLVVDL
jgi:hypothetical protein